MTVQPISYAVLMTGASGPLNIRLPKVLLAKAKEKAKAEGRTRSWAVKALLFLYITGQVDLVKMAQEAGL